jgi:hypothetical protein
VAFFTQKGSPLSFSFSLSFRLFRSRRTRNVISSGSNTPRWLLNGTRFVVGLLGMADLAVYYCSRGYSLISFSPLSGVQRVVIFYYAMLFHPSPRQSPRVLFSIWRFHRMRLRPVCAKFSPSSRELFQNRPSNLIKIPYFFKAKKMKKNREQKRGPDVLNNRAVK